MDISLASKIVKYADDKKASDIKLLNISDLTTIADYFVICHANSNTQMNAIFGEIEEKLRKEDGINLLNPEARSSTGWLLMDYGDVIVHIFNEETREFYGIEKLWADAENIDISEMVK